MKELKDCIGKFVYASDESSDFWLFDIDEVGISSCTPKAHIFAYSNGSGYSINVGMDVGVEFDGKLTIVAIFDNPQDLMNQLMSRLVTEMIPHYNPRNIADSIIGGKRIEYLDLEHTTEKFIHILDIYDKWIFDHKSISPGSYGDWIEKCGSFLDSQSNDDVNLENSDTWPHTLDSCIIKEAVVYNTAGELLKDIEMYLRYELECVSGLRW